MRTSSHKLVSLLFGLLISCGVLAADPVAVNPSHPDRYVVVPGDTLWDISGRFLRHPWRWPDVWYANPQIENPHLIYPGDVIVMSFVNGQPRLSLERGSLVKLSPRVRETPLDGAIPAIPIDAIHQFLTRPFVLDLATLESAPYVVAFSDQRIRGSSENKAYVRSITSTDNTRFDIVRPGGAYKDADTGEILGYEALFVGSGILQRTGDPATVAIGKSDIEVKDGDRLFPVAEEEPLNAFYPKAPERSVNGSIISVLGGLQYLGQYQIAVLDRGASDGLMPGDVLAVDQRGRTIRDDVSPNPMDKVTLPDEPAGLVMVFRTFDRISFALVMEASREIKVLDRVHNP